MKKVDFFYWPILDSILCNKNYKLDKEYIVRVMDDISSPILCYRRPFYLSRTSYARGRKKSLFSKIPYFFKLVACEIGLARYALVANREDVLHRCFNICLSFLQLCFLCLYHVICLDNMMAFFTFTARKIRVILIVFFIPLLLHIHRCVIFTH